MWFEHSFGVPNSIRANSNYVGLEPSYLLLNDPTRMSGIKGRRVRDTLY